MNEQTNALRETVASAYERARDRMGGSAVVRFTDGTYDDIAGATLTDASYTERDRVTASHCVSEYAWESLDRDGETRDDVVAAIRAGEFDDLVREIAASLDGDTEEATR